MLSKRQGGRDVLRLLLTRLNVFRMMKNRTCNKVLPKNDVFTVFQVGILIREDEKRVKEMKIFKTFCQVLKIFKLLSASFFILLVKVPNLKHGKNIVFGKIEVCP